MAEDDALKCVVSSSSSAGIVHYVPTIASMLCPQQHSQVMIALQVQAAGTTISGIMRDASKRVPSYIWLLALPQLISRICHSNPEVNELNKYIICHVAAAFPQQVKHTKCSSTASPYLPDSFHFGMFTYQHLQKHS